jgi:very-short-patch-repair endonuclease
MKKLTIQNFIERANLIHNNKYDYSLVEYVNIDTKVKIVCTIHGVFEQSPNKHISKTQRGCPKCNGGIKLENDDFIERCKKIHNNKYDYSLVDYANANTNIKIICPIHGIFEQKPKHHINGSGCSMCNNDSIKYNQLNSEQFILEAIKIHGDKYDYSLVDYKNSNDKIKIICPIHGMFEQSPRNHKNRQHGCPGCCESKGERKIKQLLNNNNIQYIRQKIFDKCIDKTTLPFDFFLPNYNLCIEYDGKQHFEKIDYWGGEENLKYIQNHDNIKNDFCENNNINLLRISYKDDIEKKLIEYGLGF